MREQSVKLEGLSHLTILNAKAGKENYHLIAKKQGVQESIHGSSQAFFNYNI